MEKIMSLGLQSYHLVQQWSVFDSQADFIDKPIMVENPPPMSHSPYRPSLYHFQVWCVFSLICFLQEIGVDAAYHG